MTMGFIVLATAERRRRLMQRKLFSWLMFSVCCLVVPLPVRGQSTFSGPSQTNFCKPHNIRETVVYIDETILIADQAGWALSIYDKLHGTLVPGERVTLVELSPQTGQHTDVWEGCWPDYTEEERAKIAQQTYLFSQNPLDALKEQQGIFVRGFGVGAEKIQKKGERQVSAVTIDPANPPQKSILRALASDGARYSQSDSGTIRVILYSDLAENSDLGSVFKGPPAQETPYGSMLGTYLTHSVFYAFGVGNDVRGGGKVLDDTRAFWNHAIRSMAGTVNGLGSDLSVPNIRPVKSWIYNVSLIDNGQSLVGRLSLLTDKGGTLVDSQIGIVRLHNASLNGFFRCKSGGASSCSLQADTVGGVITESPSEKLTLASHDSTTITGTIGVLGSSATLPITATPAEE
jgi:hypothetical protein